VTGVEAVVAPGELIEVGGPLRKDVAGYDLKNLLVGSEGTLGVITAVWLRLIPAPTERRVTVEFFDSIEAGCETALEVIGSGLRPSALEFLDGRSFAAAAAGYPGDAPRDPAFVLIAEYLDDGVGTSPDPASLWRWRDTVHGAVTSLRGGKLSEDVAVPVERLADALGRLSQIGAAHGLETCAWGHAGDGNIHATFLIAPEQAPVAERAAQDVFAMAVELGGTVSGEHGTGCLKRGYGGPLDARIKAALDPKGLLNPGKKS
jgi:FAD/FMN-containing dehydrogenase